MNQSGSGQEDLESIEINSLEEWRFWLEDHWEQDDGVWVVTWKKHRGDNYVSYDDIVDEAICYGWIDSHQRRVDDDRTRLYVSPRRKGSPWSEASKKRAQRLLEQDRLMAPGLAKIRSARKDGSWRIYDEIEDSIEPPDLKLALADNPEALKHWKGFRGEAKKQLLWWIKSAAKPETRAARIGKVVDAASRGRVANHTGKHQQ